MFNRFFPQAALKRQYTSFIADILILLGVFALLLSIASISSQLVASFNPPEISPTISLDLSVLPAYAGRSMFRMFAALFFSILFSIVYGYVAAHHRQAEKILVPLLDILQSVPVLGFLSVTITLFIALFPGSLMGLEAASIFAIFTSQAWNITFSFYESLRTVPKDLREAAHIYQLTPLQFFSKIELPWSMINMVWNAMMSFGGGWFFLAASEAISVLNQNYTLPGIGSYVSAAIQAQDMRALGFAIITMSIMILLTDQLFWRPVVAWSQTYKYERSGSSDTNGSWVLNLIKHSHLPDLVGKIWSVLREKVILPLETRKTAVKTSYIKTAVHPTWQDKAFDLVLLLILAFFVVRGFTYVLQEVSVTEIGQVILFGAITLLRVLILVAIATLIWTPIGVLIGFNPRFARIAQPFVQFLSSFPANFLFPFAVVFFVKSGIEINYGGILLMALGAQWYILFNVIAGAMRIPNDMREMAINMGLHGWQLWKKVIIPGIFPAWVTGGITAAGGAWNASIIAEYVTWGNQVLIAHGLGAYIAQVTASGDWPRIALGVGMMSVFVVGVNRIVWRKLYDVAEQRYHLE